MIILVEMTKRLAKVIVRVSATGCRMWPEIKMPAFPLPFFEREREKKRERERKKRMDCSRRGVLLHPFLALATSSRTLASAGLC